MYMLSAKEYDNKKDFIRCFIKECREIKSLRIPCSCGIYRVEKTDKNTYFEVWKFFIYVSTDGKISTSASVEIPNLETIVHFDKTCWGSEYHDGTHWDNDLRAFLNREVFKECE